jgi:hypothetical protein
MTVPLWGDPDSHLVGDPGFAPEILSATSSSFAGLLGHDRRSHERSASRLPSLLRSSGHFLKHAPCTHAKADGGSSGRAPQAQLPAGPRRGAGRPRCRFLIFSGPPEACRRRHPPHSGGASRAAVVGAPSLTPATQSAARSRYMAPPLALLTSRPPPVLRPVRVENAAETREVRFSRAAVARGRRAIWPARPGARFLRRSPLHTEPS